MLGVGVFYVVFFGVEFCWGFWGGGYVVDLLMDGVGNRI